MSDRKGDKSKQPPECKIEFENHCPHIKETGSMQGEQYDCPVCGERFYLDYEEMR